MAAGTSTTQPRDNQPGESHRQEINTTQPGDNQPGEFLWQEINIASGTSTTQPVPKELIDTEKQRSETLCWKYLPLRTAVLRGDWERTRELLDHDARNAPITELLETVLHIAVTARKSIDLVERLAELMSAEALERRDVNGFTALHSAAWCGNTTAARILVNKHPNLLYICVRRKHWLPVHLAAESGQKDTLSYLLTVTDGKHPVVMDSATENTGGFNFHEMPHTPFTDQSGAELLVLLISSELYDVALELLDKFPRMALVQLEDGRCALGEMTKKVSAFRWQTFLTKKLRAMLWKLSEILGPHGMTRIQEQKLRYLQALKLLKRLCELISSLGDFQSYKALAEIAVIEAASLGIVEIVEQVIDTFPTAISATDSENRNLFQLAVIHRHANILNLLCQMDGYKQSMTWCIDKKGNNILHLAARLPPSDKLKLVPGAGLQIQRELEWFKATEQFVKPSFKVMKNQEGETPAMVFSREHVELAREGEKWMKDIANACIAPALVATVVFGAAITIPGGNNGTSGLPIFRKEKSFLIFTIFNTISFFTAVASLLMFLSIYYSSFSEVDFLYILPRRLARSFTSLYLAIISMTIAFNLVLYLAFGSRKGWIFAPMVAFEYILAFLYGVPFSRSNDFNIWPLQFRQAK